MEKFTGLKRNIKKGINLSIRIFRPKLKLETDKHTVELNFWKKNFADDSKKFRNSWYEKTMLSIAQEKDSAFLEGKVVADFGCGPRGSLVWAKNASLRIGIDVLADVYFDEFSTNIIEHNMVYLKSTERAIPLPSNFVDILFTMNAIDHVDNFGLICNEIIRIIKPGGELIASFNLNEPASATEPQKLTESILADNLLSKLEVKSYRISNRVIGGDPYQAFFDNILSYMKGEEAFLWVRAIKRIL